MTRLLASVATLTEIDIALAAGVDIIDLKNPHIGALGSWSLPTIKQAVRHVNGACPLSAASGDPHGDIQTLARTLHTLATSGVSFVKFALGCDPQDDERLGVLGQITWQHSYPVAVVFADLARQRGHTLTDPTWLRALAKAGCAGLMIDTLSKPTPDTPAPRLPHIMSKATLHDLVTRARHAGLQVGIAGALRHSDIDLVRHVRPDIVGFRGALCTGGHRRSRLSARRISHMRHALSAQDKPRRATETAGAHVAARDKRRGSPPSSPSSKRVSMPL